MPDVRIAIDGVIGEVNSFINPSASGVRIAIPGIIGVIKGLIELATEVRVSSSGVIGYLRVVAKSLVDDWQNAGFPCPSTGYTYSSSYGLERTLMISGAVRQRRKWTDGYKVASVKFLLHRDKLFDMEAFLDAKGYDWFNMGIIINDTTGEAAIHAVRVKTNPTFSTFDGNMLNVDLQIEIKQDYVPPAGPG